MKIQEGGNEHVVGDRNCPGCESPEGQQFPQPHRDAVTTCAPGWFMLKSLGNRKQPLVRLCSTAAMCVGNRSKFSPRSGSNQKELA
jgi:hypothetical protein